MYEKKRAENYLCFVKNPGELWINLESYECECVNDMFIKARVNLSSEMILGRRILFRKQNYKSVYENIMQSFLALQLSVLSVISRHSGSINNFFIASLMSKLLCRIFLVFNFYMLAFIFLLLPRIFIICVCWVHAKWQTLLIMYAQGNGTKWGFLVEIKFITPPDP